MKLCQGSDEASSMSYSYTVSLGLSCLCLCLLCYGVFSLIGYSSVKQYKALFFLPKSNHISNNWNVLIDY